MNPLSLFYSVKSYVDSYAGLIGRRFISVLWVGALCVVIWWYGALLGFGSIMPLVPAFNRVVLIALVILCWLFWLLRSVIVARRHDKAMIDDIEKDALATEASGNAELTEIHTRLREALALLKRISNKRFGYVYELPWYVIFGAAGSGKTTALTHSGLKFPLGDALGQTAVQGIGGTRNCNWWFAEEAILIDTAGRYTTQDDLNGTAKAGWEGFLSLLKRYRPSQPVNGVMVTLSIADLINRDAQAQAEEVRALRQRLAELDRFLQARVPVYLMLTKADLLTGFVDFFDGLSKSDRDQVWGMTFKLEESRSSAALPEHFLEEYALLQERIGAMLLERMQQEPDAALRGRIFRLPAELEHLKERVYEALEALCASSKLVEAPLLRGVYFVSGTQPVPTVNPSLPQIREALVRPRRSYFLHRLFKDVIFEEAALVARDKRLSQRQIMVRRGAYGLAGLTFAVVLAGWLNSYANTAQALTQAQDSIVAYKSQIEGIPVRDVADADFLRVLPALDSLRGATGGFESDGWMPQFGLDQQYRIADQHRGAYGNALNALLLPRLLVQLQREIATQRDAAEPDVARTFNALKLYGMLGGLGPVDVDFVGVQVQDVFARLYPGEGRRATRAALTAHAEAMAQGTLVPIDLDTTLIADARAIIADQSLGSRAFDILTDLRAARALAPWIAADAFGPLGEQVFMRKSGAPLRTPMPGLYTGTGYRSVVLPRALDAARQALNENWVRGWQVAPSGMTLDVVTQATLQLYFDQFERRWNALLSDITTQPSQSLADATETLRILSAEPGPVETGARNIAAATDLRALSRPELALAGKATQALGNAANAALAAGANAPDPYAELRAALDVLQGASGGEASEAPRSRVAGLRSILQKLYGQLSRASTSSADVAQVFDIGSQLTSANQDLLQEARTLPVPLDQWMASVSADIGALSVKTARGQIGNAWAANGASLCTSIVTGRYPFDRNSSRDVALTDFVRLFGPTGTFQSFFTERLAPFVDTSSTPWGWRGTFGAGAIESQALAQFENADKIHRAFFPAASAVPSIAITVKPVSLTRTSTAVLLEIEGEKLVHFQDRQQSKSFRWPSTQASKLSRVAFQPGGWQQAISANGDWSPFRLFDGAQLKNEGQDLMTATFRNGEQSAAFDVQFGSVLNPFRLPALAQFQCPTQF